MKEHAFQDHQNFSTDGLTIVVAGVTLLSRTSATTKISSEGSGSITCSKSSMTSTYLEASWAPVHELNAPLALDSGDGGVDILGHHVAPVEHAAGHVLAVPGRGEYLRTDQKIETIKDHKKRYLGSRFTM